jgi:DNA invertase Pin-like site-specific DNA recombinase
MGRRSSRSVIRSFATSTSQGRLLVTMLAAIAEFEREVIRERTGAGRQRAMAAKLSDFRRKEALQRRGKGETLARIARSYAVSLSMISRL